MIRCTLMQKRPKERTPLEVTAAQSNVLVIVKKKKPKCLTTKTSSGSSSAPKYYTPSVQRRSLRFSPQTSTLMWKVTTRKQLTKPLTRWNRRAAIIQKRSINKSSTLRALKKKNKIGLLSHHKRLCTKPRAPSNHKMCQKLNLPPQN